MRPGDKEALLSASVSTVECALKEDVWQNAGKVKYLQKPKCLKE